MSFIIIKTMDDQKIQFQEYHISRSSLEEESKLIGWIIRYSGGLIKDKNQAIYALLGFAITAIIISMFLFLSSSKKKTLTPKIMDDTFNPAGGSIQN